MVNLDEMMLQEEVGENEGGTDVDNVGDGMEKNRDGDVEEDVEMSEPLFCKSKNVEVQASRSRRRVVTECGFRSERRVVDGCG